MAIGCPLFTNLVTHLEERRQSMLILSRQTKCLFCGDGSRVIAGKQHRLIAWGNHVTVILKYSAYY